MIIVISPSKPIAMNNLLITNISNFVNITLLQRSNEILCMGTSMFSGLTLTLQSWRFGFKIHQSLKAHLAPVVRNLFKLNLSKKDRFSQVG